MVLPFRYAFLFSKYKIKIKVRVRIGLGLASFMVIITINFRVGHTEIGYPFYIDHIVYRKMAAYQNVTPEKRQKNPRVLF